MDNIPKILDLINSGPNDALQANYDYYPEPTISRDAYEFALEYDKLPYKSRVLIRKMLEVVREYN